MEVPPSDHSKEQLENEEEGAEGGRTMGATASAPEGTRFQLASDLHLEFRGSLAKQPTIPVNSPILCLLGDIGYPNKSNYRTYLLYQAERFEHVLVVAGNHEYYNQTSVEEANRQIESICSERENLHFLNKSSVRIGDVVYMGCTLWPNISAKSIDLLRVCCNDYRVIRAEGPKPTFSTIERWIASLTFQPKDSDEAKQTHVISPQETNQWHQEHVAWLASEINKIKEENEVRKRNGEKGQLKVVVLTHHAPSRFRCIMPQEEEIVEMNFGNAEWLMEEPLVVWGHGHTHWSCDNIIGSTRVVSNQCGYVTTSKDGKGSNYYDPGFVVDINETIETVKSTPPSTDGELRRIPYPSSTLSLE